MKGDRQIYKAIHDLVDQDLATHNFSRQGSSGGSYFRRVNDDLFHFIVFDIFRDRRRFDIKAYPSSPRLGNWDHFPDAIGMPTGHKAGLNAKLGVGHGASIFPCSDLAALTSSVTIAALPALLRFAVPYLDGFRGLDDLIPVLEHPQWASLLREP